MAATVRAGLTPAEGRRFGLTVGIAFLFLGAISWWRGHDTAPWVLWGLGGVLVAAGAVVPGRLGPVYRGWMAFGLALSKITTPLFMGILYFLLLTPTGWIRRAFGGTPLVRKTSNGSYWVDRPADHAPTSMFRQF